MSDFNQTHWSFTTKVVDVFDGFAHQLLDKICAVCRVQKDAGDVVHGVHILNKMVIVK